MGGPKETFIYWIDYKVFIKALKFPYLIPLCIELTPPTKSQEETATDIFDCPEIEGGQDYNYNEGDDIRQKEPQDQITG